MLRLIGVGYMCRACVNNKKRSQGQDKKTTEVKKNAPVDVRSSVILTRPFQIIFMLVGKSVSKA